MTRDDIIRIAKQAAEETGTLTPTEWNDPLLERFAALVAAEKEQQMIRYGYRQCAKGQRTTQFCGLLDAAVKDEREACAKLAEPSEEHRRDASWGYAGGEGGVELLDSVAAAIRARSE